MAYGAPRRRVACILRRRAPDDARAPSACSADAGRLEETARSSAIRDFFGAPDRHAAPVADLSLPDIRPRLRPTGYSREGLLSAAEVRSRFAARLGAAVGNLGIEIETGGAPDERWYWLAPMLLDFSAFPKASTAWWGREDLASLWAGVEAGEEDDGWSNHVGEAAKVITDVREGRERLGVQPEDLFDVLALAASAAPATAALRAYLRTSDSDPAASLRVREMAARTGRAFLTLFNHAEVTEAIRADFRGEPYWERVLEYVHAGGLQAVLDEYAHLLRESMGLAVAPVEECAREIAGEIIAALTLRAASLRIDDVTAPPYAREVKMTTEPMRIRFAMRFGDDRYDEELSPAFDGAPARTRKESVRAAFNSPFWPFVLVSTTVGQEGLDFHHYCHSVTHWNLPSNPVDLEQREGRVHRYKGHAVRRNVAAALAAEVLARSQRDVWGTIFELARERRLPGKSDLVPYWIFAGDSKIERHVPALPFSREVEHLNGLRHALAIYRMVFGQSRQEDLIAYLLAQIPENQRDAIVAELQIDLSPVNRTDRAPQDRGGEKTGSELATRVAKSHCE